MKIVCPHCGQVCETAEDVVLGQHIICPYCETKFSYGDLPGMANIPQAEKRESDAVPAANPPKVTKNKVVFDFNRCEQELSAKWHRKVKPEKFKWTKGKIAFWSIVVLFNLVFLIFGLPTCLDEWQTRKAEEQARQRKLLEEHEYSGLREWYEKQLRYNGLAEVTMGPVGIKLADFSCHLPMVAWTRLFWTIRPEGVGSYILGTGFNLDLQLSWFGQESKLPNTKRNTSIE